MLFWTGTPQRGVMSPHHICLVGLFSLSFLQTFPSNLGSFWSSQSRILRFLWKLPAPSNDGRCHRRLTSAPGYLKRLGFSPFFFFSHPQRPWKYSFTAKGRERRAQTRSRGCSQSPAPRAGGSTPRHPLPPGLGACATPPLRTEKMAASALGWLLRGARQVSPPPSLPRSPSGPCPTRPRRRGAGRAR